MRDYVTEAGRTEPTDHKQIQERYDSERMVRMMHGALGLVTESAELADALKKHLYYGKPLDTTNIKEEIGDIFWYAALICRTLDVSFEDVMYKNIEKLRARFPQKFSESDAINRDLGEERRVLESDVSSE